MKERITPEELTSLDGTDNVLIGTNEAGIHGAGIARYAMDHWGAVRGQGFGAMGNCFGLPTKDWEIDTLPLGKIEFYVQRYIAWTQIARNNRWKNYVTKIGCGLAGYTPEEIAPMFAKCLKMKNIWLPQDFITVINNPITWKYVHVSIDKHVGIDTDRYGNTVGY